MKRTGHWFALTLALISASLMGWVRQGIDRPASTIPHGMIEPLGLAGAGSFAPVLVSQQPFQLPEDALDGGIAWINTRSPIHLSDLRGKIVLLDFWTYCCINCHHILPDLEKLEAKYPNELVVIGVHTAKFDAEKDTENIRKKVAEYRIRHPVINDANQVLWRNFQVNSWPTLALIDAQGRYVGSVSGEGHYEVLDRTIGNLVKEHRGRKELNETPLRFEPEADKPVSSALLFPGKVLADEPGNRLFITDTGHNRIVITDLEGKHLGTIGDGTAGPRDGGYAQAQFNRPQGLCLVGETLYVADTENHAIRAVDLTSKMVTRIAGTGVQGYQRKGGGPATSTALSSPWDVLPKPGEPTLLYIAMAGTHQIWTLNTAKGEVAAWAGSGIENIIDGTRERAAFAQPSGLATDGKFLFVADSEVSGIRAISLSRNAVQTVVGVHLFGFGDVDGKGIDVRLQHCLGLAYGQGKLYIADSYNNKVKVCEPASRTVRSYLGSRQSGATDNPPLFDEPGGLSLAGSTLYVADSNNHAIRAINLESNQVRTLSLEGAEKPSPPKSKPSFAKAREINLPEAKAAPGKAFKLQVSITAPEGYKINPDAPMPYRLEAATGGEVSLASAPDEADSRIDPPSLEFTLDVALKSPARSGQKMTLKLYVSAFLCQTSLCEVRNYALTVPVLFEAGAPDTVAIKPQEASKSDSQR